MKKLSHAFRLLSALLLALPLAGFADYFGDFYTFNARLLGGESRIAQESTNLSADLKKFYGEVASSNPAFKEEVAARETALKWLGEKPSLEELDTKLREISGDKLQISRLEDGSYEKARLVQLYTLSLMNAAKTQQGRQDPLLYYVRGRSEYHFYGRGKDMLEQFIALNTKTDPASQKRVQEAKEMIQLIDALNVRHEQREAGTQSAHNKSPTPKDK
jgi:hypothetical protein